MIAAVDRDFVLFTSLFIKHLGHHVKWPEAAERRYLGSLIPFLPGCIGYAIRAVNFTLMRRYIDGTFCQIRRPSKRVSEGVEEDEDLQYQYYSRRKRTHGFNNLVVFDHLGYIRTFSAGHAGALHSV